MPALATGSSLSTRTWIEPAEGQLAPESTSTATDYGVSADCGIASGTGFTRPIARLQVLMYVFV